MKIIYYKLVKITINALYLVEIIINIVINYYSFLDSIVINKSLLFKLKFWLLLCYFFSIKQKLFIAFYL